MWKSPIVKEISVGLEINCYACAEVLMTDDLNLPPNIDLAATMKVIKKLMPDLKFFSISTAEQNRLVNKYGVKKGPRNPGPMKARGGSVKKYAQGGGVRKVSY